MKHTKEAANISISSKKEVVELRSKLLVLDKFRSFVRYGRLQHYKQE
jgi:hypothetical protein